MHQHRLDEASVRARKEPLHCLAAVGAVRARRSSVPVAEFVLAGETARAQCERKVGDLLEPGKAPVEAVVQLLDPVGGETSDEEFDDELEPASRS